MKVSQTYVDTYLRQMENELFIDHRKVAEIERLRHFEDPIMLAPQEQITGLQVRTGMTAELVEKVKAAILSSVPNIQLVPQVQTDDAKANASKRSQMWNRVFRRKILDAYTDAVDSIVANGKGIIKLVMSDWPQEPRARLDDETTDEYNERIRALKRTWGPPIDADSPHVRSFYPRFGKGGHLVEAVEHSYKARPDVYQAFGIADSKALREMALDKRLLSPEVSGIASRSHAEEMKEVAAAMAASIGIPYPIVESLPAGIDTTTRALVTEYWQPSYYQAYVDRRCIYEAETGEVGYFMCRGRRATSKDPDKQGISIAEAFRHNEPTVNRALTRLMEAIELLVSQRLTIELPVDGDMEFETDSNGEQKPKQYTFSSDHAEALPPGAKVVNPYQAVQGAFAAMPAINLLLDMMSRQGVNPIFTGNSPGAGSGYRDTSLYAMAKSQFDYVVGQIAAMVGDIIRWCEHQVVYTLDRTIYLDELELSPAEISKFPCTVTVVIEPNLPQNTIPEGQFYAGLNEKGKIPDRILWQKVIPGEDPVALERELLADELKKQLRPVLAADILMSVGANSPVLGNGESPGGPGGPNNPAGNQANTFRTSITQGDGRRQGGVATGGMPRVPETMPGATIQNNGRTPQ